MFNFYLGLPHTGNQNMQRATHQQLNLFTWTCQVALVSQSEHQSPNTILNGDHTSHEQNTSDDGDEDRIVDDSEDPPPAKKAKKADVPLNMMGNAVNSKKVGGIVMLMSLYLQ